MDVNYINPFLVSTINTFQKTLGCTLKRATPYLKKKPQPEHEIGSIVHLSGKVQGFFILGFSHEVAFKVAEVLNEERPSEINSDVLDAITELTNKIIEGSLPNLRHLEVNVNAPPERLTKDHTIEFPTKVIPICIPFESEWGIVTVEAGLGLRIMSPAEIQM